MSSLINGLTQIIKKVIALIIVFFLTWAIDISLIIWFLVYIKYNVNDLWVAVSDFGSIFKSSMPILKEFLITFSSIITTVIKPILETVKDDILDPLLNIL